MTISGACTEDEIFSEFAKATDDDGSDKLFELASKSDFESVTQSFSVSESFDVFSARSSFIKGTIGETGVDLC